MKKLLLTNLILLIILSICGCSNDTITSNEDKIFQAIAEAASKNSNSAGDTNRSFFNDRFEAYYEVLERLNNAGIINSGEVERFKEAGKENKESIQNYLTDPSKNQNMSNYITSNCSWCLGADTLLKLLHFLSYLNTAVVAQYDQPDAAYYSMFKLSPKWFEVDASETTQLYPTDPISNYYGIDLKNIDRGSLQTIIDKIYAIVSDDNVLKAISDGNLDKNSISIEQPENPNKFIDFFTEGNNNTPSVSLSKITQPSFQQSSHKMSSVMTSQKTCGEHIDDREGAVKDGEDLIKENIYNFTKAGRYAVMTYIIKSRIVTDPQTGESHTYYKAIVNIYEAPILKINNWVNKENSGDKIIDLSYKSSRLIGIEDRTQSNQGNFLGLSTLTTSKTTNSKSDSLINSKIYVFNPTRANMENIDKFLGFMKKYETSSGNNQKKVGDEIFKYLKDTYEVLEGKDGGMFKCSTGNNEIALFDNLFKHVATGESLSSKNNPAKIGKDFIYDYYDLPLFSLRLYEIKADADQKIDKMRENKKLEGYMTINLSENNGKGSVQFRTWQRLDVINKITTTGVDVIHSDLIYDFKEQLWYKVVVNAGGSGISFNYEELNNIPDSQIQFDAPGDNLNNDERKLIFTRENFSNQDVPYFDINKTVMSGTEPGHLLLLEYRCLYDITDSKMVQENQDRKLTDKAWLPIGRRVYFNADNIAVEDGENGESVYRWVKAKTPVAYLSDPISGRINTDYPLFCDSFTDITHSQKLNTIIDLENESATYNNGNYQNTGGLNIIADNQDLIRYTANGQ